MLNRTKIITRVSVGFSLILLAAMLLGGIGARSIGSLVDATTQTFRNPFTVSIAIRDAKTEVLVAQQVMNLLVHQAAPSEVGEFKERIQQQREITNEKLALVRERYLGDPADLDKIDRALAQWRNSRTRTADLVAAGQRAEAIIRNEDVDRRLVEAVVEAMDVVLIGSARRAERYKEAAEEEGQEAKELIVALLVSILVFGIAMTVLVTRSVRSSLAHASSELRRIIQGSAEKARIAEAIGAGNLDQTIALTEPLQVDLRQWPDDEMGELIKAAVDLSHVQRTFDESFQRMTESLRLGREEQHEANWLKTGVNELGILMREEQSPMEMADKVLNYIAKYLDAGVGALYFYEEHAESLHLVATYAFTRRRNLSERFALGEGIIGQAARERKAICVSKVPPDYLPIASALGESAPGNVTAIPLVHGKRLLGALEVGSFRELRDVELEFLDLAVEGIAIGLSVAQSRQRMSELLEQTQRQTEELRVQQEELQQSNEELEERAQMLEEQREDIRAKNQEIEAASEDLRNKAAELQRVSSYKSEFLANMSHELRTPLNSLLILSRLLMENREGNLSDKQVEFATTIHSAGSDLLTLINDILDLAKVEAGHMDFRRDAIEITELLGSIRALFEPLAEQKGLVLELVAEGNAPPVFKADEQRVQQILTNLLSNAVKFTEKGKVAVHVSAPAGDANPLSVPAIAFSVCDTGIGISAAKQALVFQAFQQADGSISRKYGGTGLGLSISLQLARCMNGDLRMESVEGEGSTFTLYLPVTATYETRSDQQAADEAASPVMALRRSLPARAGGSSVPVAAGRQPDDVPAAGGESRTVLIVEDDPAFAQTMETLILERGFAVLRAADGESGVALAERHLPSAIILDVMLPRIDGWGVMRRLKDNPRTRHIPVHFITCVEDKLKALSMGAIGFVTKPVDLEQLEEVFQAIEGSWQKAVKRLLIVEDDKVEADSMVALLEDRDVVITVATTGHDAIALLATQNFDCLVLDLGLADMSGFELLEHMQKLDHSRRIPVIIHSGRDLSYDEERKLRRFAESIIIKGAKSPERLLNEVSLFLHLVETRLAPNKQRMIRSALDKEAMLAGRKVLLVDDDMRNIFSLSSVLTEKDMMVIEADNGREALARLEEHPDVSVVLMDIMMPEVDGYTAMRQIRKDPRFMDLPIIAMTAKALKGDYEKCIEAGASDYISKPIEVEKLLSLIRVWLYQHT